MATAGPAWVRPNLSLAGAMFPNRREAVVIVEAFRRKYNEVRPHSSLDYRTPLGFKKLVQERATGATLSAQNATVSQ